MLNERQGYFSRLWRLVQGGAQQPRTETLYRAIVAQTRLRPFYEGLGVPDTLQGRYFVLSLHLFAVLHRLKQEGETALPLAQALVDRFAADMDTVAREQGVSDLRIPKTVRGVSAAFEGASRRYAEALLAGGIGLAEHLAEDLPREAKAAAPALATYVRRMVEALNQDSLPALAEGRISFPPVPAGDGGYHA